MTPPAPPTATAVRHPQRKRRRKLAAYASVADLGAWMKAQRPASQVIVIRTSDPDKAGFATMFKAGIAMYPSHPDVQALAAIGPGIVTAEGAPERARLGAYEIRRGSVPGGKGYALLGYASVLGITLTILYLQSARTADIPGPTKDQTRNAFTEALCIMLRHFRPDTCYTPLVSRVFRNMDFAQQVLRTPLELHIDLVAEGAPIPLGTGDADLMAMLKAWFAAREADGLVSRLGNIELGMYLDQEWYLGEFILPFTWRAKGRTELNVLTGATIRIVEDRHQLEAIEAALVGLSCRGPKRHLRRVSIPSARDEAHNGLPGGFPMLDVFLPVVRMRDRGSLARDESDAAFFLELLYLGEMVVKLLVVELLAGMQDDREGHRYALEYRLVRADGLGEWAEVLDQILTGPASQHLLPPSRESQRQLAESTGPGGDAWQRRAVDLLNEACRCLDADTDDVSNSRISMRMWVRQFVWLRNRTRGHGSPKAATLSTICPELELSIAEIVENAPAFQRSWAHLRRNLRGKYRVSGFGGNREDFAYLTRERDHSLQDGPYVYIGVPRAATLLFTDAELTDFFLPNGNYRNGQFEAVSYITDDRRTENGAAYTLPPGAQPASETGARPALDLIGNVFTNLPPKREGYISRSALETELTSHLTDSRHPVVTLHGRGGVGKTSLALKVLHDLAKTDNFFAIIWFSARDIDLLPEGPRVVKADVLSTEDVARDFANLMHTEEKGRLSVAQQYLTDCLSGQSQDGPFLFVFDNFETFREQAALYAYASNAVRLPNKVLITTRSRDFKGDYPIEVGGMERIEYHALVAETSAKLGILELIDGDYENELYEESDGHPYITKVLLGEAAKTGGKVGLKRVVATKDGVLDALFDRSYVALSPGAQRVFLTLCSWRSMVPRIGLEAVLMRPGNERIDVVRAMAELRQSSLVEELEADGGGDVFLSVPLAAALFGKRKLVTSPLKIAIDADMELVRGFGAVSPTQVSNGLAPRLERLTRSVAHRAERNQDLTQELSVIEYIATEYPPAWLNLATLQQEMGDKAGAVDSVNHYLQSRPEDQEAWGRLVILYRSMEDVLGEMHARLQLAELARPPFNELSAAASRLNGLLSRGEIELGADERRLMVSRFRKLMEDRSEEADATDLSRLAWVCMYDHDKIAAERWAQEGLRLEPNNQHCLKLMRRLAE